jgi:O-antigen ligase
LTLRRALGVVAGLAFAVPVLAAWAHPAVPIALRLFSLAVLAVTALRPASGLLLVAAATPLAPLAQALSGAPFGSAEATELLVAPFLAAAGLRLAFSAPSGSRLVRPAVVMAAIVAAAGLVGLGVEQRATAPLNEFAASLFRHVRTEYYISTADFPALHRAAFWIEALALAVIAEGILRRSPDGRAATVRVLLVGAGALAAFSVYRFFQVSLGRTDAWAAAWELLRRARFHPFYSDLNAAGSALALLAVPAIWMAARGAWRGAIVAAPLLGFALWCTGSRAALVALVAGLGAAVWLGVRRAPRVLYVAGALAVIGVGWLAIANTGRSVSGPGLAIGIRIELAEVGLRLVAERPVFGIGLGEFKPRSARYVTPELIAAFPRAAAGENAHNNFVQIAAELGLVGLAAFLWLLAAPAGVVARRVRDRTASPALVGLAGGVLAFLVTSLAGHPLLIVPVLFLFLLTLGVATGVSAPDAPQATAPLSGRGRWGAAAAAVVLISSVPLRIASEHQAADLDNVVIGASRVAGRLDEVDYRLAEAHSTWFVAVAARHLEIPLRLTADSSPACRVEIALDGRPADRATPTGSEWLRLLLPLSPPAPDQGSRRIDLTVTGDSCSLMVGPIRER